MCFCLFFFRFSRSSSLRLFLTNKKRNEFSLSVFLSSFRLRQIFDAPKKLSTFSNSFFYFFTFRFRFCLLFSWDLLFLSMFQREKTNETDEKEIKRQVEIVEMSKQFMMTDDESLRNNIDRVKRVQRCQEKEENENNEWNSSLTVHSYIVSDERRKSMIWTKQIKPRRNAFSRLRDYLSFMFSERIFRSVRISYSVISGIAHALIMFPRHPMNRIELIMCYIRPTDRRTWKVLNDSAIRCENEKRKSGNIALLALPDKLNFICWKNIRKNSEMILKLIHEIMKLIMSIWNLKLIFRLFLCHQNKQINFCWHFIFALTFRIGELICGRLSLAFDAHKQFQGIVFDVCLILFLLCLRCSKSLLQQNK